MMPHHCPATHVAVSIGEKWMNREGAGGKEEEAEKQGTCLPVIPACSALLKPVASQLGSTALSRDAQVLFSMVVAGLVPSVSDRVEEEHNC